ncbi:hypothetical protein VPNG_04967 [Cytospora leucostoma]|uniref:Methyltransferase domain-containing protein n=1 Tax=Cytospora leucostoma TaxID=1230097 RepID=A0A423X7U6_9PEZI|nr:hypothetical protein VPNG_04967 [Cytospora leucostoma]
MEGYNSLGTPVNSHGQPPDLGKDIATTNQVKTEIAASENQELYGQNRETYGDRATQESLYPTTKSTDADLAPAVDFNGYQLYASSKPVPEELLREPSGTSIAPPSSVLDEENMRTYAVHETGRYFLPNDPAEQDRLDLQHKIFKIAMNGALYRAPIGSPKNVLDIATGTGIWAIQFAKEHPESNVIGTDLSLIQPLGVVDNVQFFREDSEHTEWNYPTPFDYIHLRCVLTCFDDHRTVIRKSFDNLSSGGWIELSDPVFHPQSDDGTFQGSNLERMFQSLHQAMVAMGRSFEAAQNYKKWLIEAGFVDVVEEVAPWPEAFEGYAGRYYGTLGYTVYGRKP